jgi:hypothetical protein
MFGRLLGLLLGDLLGRLAELFAPGDVVVATTSVVDGVAAGAAHVDGQIITANAILLPGEAEVEKPHVPTGGPPWPAVRQPRPRPFEQLPLRIAAFADGDTITATATLIAGRAIAPTLRIPGRAPGAALVARALLAATGRVTAWPDFIDPTIRQQNEQLLDLVMLIALIDDDVGRDERK